MIPSEITNAVLRAGDGRRGGPNPRLVDYLPGWLLRQVTQAGS